MGQRVNVATMRKLLSSYYGIDKEDVKSKQQDLDSEDFDADAYVNERRTSFSTIQTHTQQYAVKLLRNERLSSLLKKDMSLFML